MSDPSPQNGDENGVEVSAVNGQLVSPALTPISEHGDRHPQPFPAWDGDTDGQPAKAQGLSIQTDVSNSGKVRRQSSTGSPKTNKLSPLQLHDLVSSPDSLPVRAINDSDESLPVRSMVATGDIGSIFDASTVSESATSTDVESRPIMMAPVPDLPSISATPGAMNTPRPLKSTRSVSNPQMYRRRSSSKRTHPKPQPPPLQLEDADRGAINGNVKPSNLDGAASPMPAVIPAPPLSLPTYLQLELSSNRPSALYIHRSATSDFPYESSKAKFERLQNFLLLPPILEQVLWFGAVACLDAWLYTFTILPLRFLKAAAILLQWLTQNAVKEIGDMSTFVYRGLGRVWQRQRQSSVAQSRRPSNLTDATHSRRPSVGDITSDSGAKSVPPNGPLVHEKKSRRTFANLHHRRTRSTPSDLLPNHKADILQGLLIAISCLVLMRLDASRVYHNIRGQGVIKLYVIYNVLEVFDRLFSALGQDILECLFSKETLERDEYGRSKIFRPLWMFMLALAYNVVHSTALFYQVVTLNVAVNSYSNALLTLLMSNQFVEIKGTVFKKFEKENLFQLTCADIVERFQLWLMLLIIALRNIVEIGGLSISLSSVFTGPSLLNNAGNATNLPFTGGTLIPKAFTLFPKWTGEVLGPFLIVLGSEALVDWCKHAYITKFNQVKPGVYGRFLDVLAKDYYSHAFADQNLTKRLGLPVIPLSCLFIRACVQAYHMFLATYMPLPIPSLATSISLDNDTQVTNPATTAALQHIDHVFRRALGRSTFGAAGSGTSSAFGRWSLDDAIAFATMIIFFLAIYLILLAFKLVLGMALLSFARRRYRTMKERERQSTESQGRRVGGWGTVEVSEDKRRWIYDDDPDGLRQLREREERGRKRTEKGEGLKLDAVQRYSMAAKRIW